MHIIHLQQKRLPGVPINAPGCQFNPETTVNRQFSYRIWFLAIIKPAVQKQLNMISAPRPPHNFTSRTLKQQSLVRLKLNNLSRPEHKQVHHPVNRSLQGRQKLFHFIPGV
jgi:hypothetical protein